MGKFDLSEKLYKEVLEIKPDYLKALNNYGNLKQQLNDYEGAIELYKKASLIEKVIGDNKKGKLPKIAIKNQANAENKKVCWRFNLKFFSKLARINKIPINIVIKEDPIKLWLFSFCKIWIA